MLALPSRLALFSAVIAIVAVSGAALAWDGPTSTTWSAASAIGEYRNEARNLKLAPGWHWPAKLPFGELGDDGERVSYWKGLGANLADAHWFCSWASRALSSSVPPRARRQALEQLATVRDTASYKSLIPDERARQDTMIARALRGRTSSLREYAAANCASPSLAR